MPIIKPPLYTKPDTISYCCWKSFW